MLAVWIGVAVLIWLHARVGREYVALLDQAGVRVTADTATPLRQIIPARYADAQMWVRHALTADAERSARVRTTHVDNAPVGREVHWSSVFVWLMRGAAALHHRLTADGWPGSLERTLLWFNAPLLGLVVIVISSWCVRRLGLGAGVVSAAAMLGHPRLYEGFAPAYVDHHGLITAAVLGLILGSVFMGAGWWKAPLNERSPGLPESMQSARRAARISAACGAGGLWLSAASVLPAIAFIGLAGLLASWWQGAAARQEGAQFDPGVWRVWGRTGALLSLACYLIEYAPGHLGWRLEANHPLYALAWWGGAELVALAIPWRFEPGFAWRNAAGRLTLAGVAVAAAPLTILLGGTTVFLVGDPFVGELRHFVAEGRTLAAAVRQHGWGAVAPDVMTALLLVPAVVFLLRQRGLAAIGVGLVTGVTAGFVLMGLGEMRWWLNASAALLVLMLLGMIVATTARPAWRGRGFAALAVVLFGLAAQRVVVGQSENERQVVAAGDLLQPLYRDVAAVLRASQPTGEIVLLASPNASAGISYFGGFKSVGTLFWENAPGLRAAAEIFSATDDAEARRRLQERGVTHVVLIATANFLGEYFQLLHPTRDVAEARRGLGYRLLANPADPPRWLQPIAFRRTPELGQAGGDVALFRVVPDQSEPERLFHAGAAQAAAGRLALAEDVLTQARALTPLEGQAAVSLAAADVLYEFGGDAAAVRMFRAGLADTADPSALATLAWILATTSDDALRDGRESLAVLQPLMKDFGNDPLGLSTVAAAQAEVGRYAEAVVAAERALALVRASGDKGAEALFEKRLAQYRANRPWRQ